jgi:hypothetical protein
MSKLAMMLVAVAIVASGPGPLSAQQPGQGGAVSTGPRHITITRSGPARPILNFDGRDDDRDFPTNGFFPGDFAADPPGAAVGAAGWFGGKPSHAFDSDCARGVSVRRVPPCR